MATMDAHHKSLAKKLSLIQPQNQALVLKLLQDQDEDCQDGDDHVHDDPAFESLPETNSPLPKDEAAFLIEDSPHQLYFDDQRSISVTAQNINTSMTPEIIDILESVCADFLKQIIFQKKIVKNECEKRFVDIKKGFEEQFKYRTAIENKMTLTEAALWFEKMQLKEIRMSSMTIKQIDMWDKIAMEMVKDECTAGKGTDCGNPLDHVKDFGDLKRHSLSEYDYFVALRAENDKLKQETKSLKGLLQQAPEMAEKEKRQRLLLED
jgi:hypothetical protein